MFNQIVQEMNKRILTMAVAALALAACSENETTEVAKMGAIGFNGTGIANITRAAGVDMDAESFTEFFVFGGYDENDLFVNGETQVTVKKQGSEWAYSPIQYWETNKSYEFGAYAPVDVRGVTADWTYGTGLALGIADLNTNQYDLVYADATQTTGEDVTAIDPVALNFKHLLSKIQFVFVPGGTLDGFDVEFSNLVFAGEIVTGANWTAGANIQRTAATEVTFSEAGTLANDSKEFYMIPQANLSDAWTITCTVKLTNKITDVVSTGTIAATLPIADVTEWAEGDAYKYTATVEAKNIVGEDDDPLLYPIEFTGSVTEWISAENPEVDGGDVPVKE